MPLRPEHLLPPQLPHRYVQGRQIGILLAKVGGNEKEKKKISKENIVKKKTKKWLLYTLATQLEG